MIIKNLLGKSEVIILMLKILYAAGNTFSSKIQLSRFLGAVDNSLFKIKVAAYKYSSPFDLNIDWTLDPLLNIYNPSHLSLDDNDNFYNYYQQVKYYSPDLVISDLEYFTSNIANILNITLWQCSSSLINYAVTQNEKYNLGIYKKYAYLTNRYPIKTQKIVNIIDNANCNYVYSHFGDTPSPPQLKQNYEWIRPYHSIGKISPPCAHNIVGTVTNNNKNIFNLLKIYEDVVIFTDFVDEKYENIHLKKINNQEEYFCNLRNSNIFINEGQTSFLADAYYNNKYSIIIPNMNSEECIINCMFSEKMNLSASVYDDSKNLSNYYNMNISYKYNNIKYLHEKLKELY